jgi:hypothetical protein
MSSNASEQLSTIAVSLGKVVEHNRELCAKMFQSAQEESLRVINGRLERDAKALEAMRDSKSLSDLLSAQQDWLHESTRDYFDQMHKLSGLFWQLGEGAKEMASEVSHSTWAHSKSEAENAARRAAA